MFPILIMLVAMAIIVLQYRATKVLKLTLKEEIGWRNVWQDRCERARAELDMAWQHLGDNQEMHYRDRVRATKQWRELKDAYNALLDERMAALLKK